MLLTPAHLMYVVIGLPLVAGIISLLTLADISERHHIHHDTYSVSQVVSRTIVLVMAFMGVLGGVTVWLCTLDVYTVDPEVPLGFFAAYQITSFVAFISLIRCQVMCYDDRMFVRTWFGRQHEIPYADITHMKRTPMFLSSHFNDLVVETADGGHLTISGLLDIDQMLVRIDRFDVLENK